MRKWTLESIILFFSFFYTAWKRRAKSIALERFHTFNIHTFSFCHFLLFPCFYFFHILFFLDGVKMESGGGQLLTWHSTCLTCSVCCQQVLKCQHIWQKSVNSVNLFIMWSLWLFQALFQVGLDNVVFKNRFEDARSMILDIDK